VFLGQGVRSPPGLRSATEDILPRGVGIRAGLAG
jgi:hypothetical protein